MRYAKVVLPLPLHNTYTYAIPAHLRSKLRQGFRVIVPFGKKKYYTGIVADLTDTKPEGFEIKEIFSIPDEFPILKRPQLQLWNWVADYYLCSVGEVFKAAIPAGLKIESETFVELNPDFTDDTTPLNERESIIIGVLRQSSKKISIGDIEKKTGLTGVGLTLVHLLDKGIVNIHENLAERYQAKKETYITPEFSKEESQLQSAFKLVKGAKKQEIALLAIIEMSGLMRGESKEIKSKELKERADISQSILKALEQKGLIRITKKEINRFSYSGLISGQLPTLSEDQSSALEEIHNSWREKDVTLLRGVTSSGKTEIYMHLAKFVLEKRRQVLYLVPEIALTTQLTQRLQKVFGDKIIIYHSKFTDNERVDIWKKLLHTEEPYIIVGARSSVFLPFGHLGLVIVDEEHDASYKQQEPAPRYNGRDTAIVLARMHGAKTLLGSATPAIDTYYKALTGRFGLVELTKRFGDSLLPEIRIIDYGISKKRGEVLGSLSLATKNIIDNSISEGGQSIIFLNRRGYAPIVECKNCGWSPKCECCDVTLTFHKQTDRLTCHYCGAVYPMPQQCPECKEPNIEIKGYGTERVEDEIENSFKNISILRMDRDTTRNKDGHQTLIHKFSSGEAQILVGTQMVTKGLDFGKVSSVAILNTDALFNTPDFRASERAFNTLEQVAGRSGRRSDTQGIVAIQAYSTNHPVLSFIRKHDYIGFYNYEIEQRKAFNYPPFTRLIYIYIKHKDKEAVEELSIAYTHRLHHLFGNRIFGPEEPYVGRIQSLYIRKIMLKIETTASMQKVREILRDLYLNFHSTGHRFIKSAQIYYDVDPV
ncbi:MAG: primosomal protein N' [Paramuribaculum sp.]|nr:primosomal protein N' [Paramuribaculum sp.]